MPPPLDPTDPNAIARAIVRGAFNRAALEATDRYLDLLIDAVLDSADRDEAIDTVTALGSIPRPRVAKLVDLTAEALEDGGIR